MKIRRIKLADEKALKSTFQKTIKSKQRNKNIKTNSMREKRGKVHVQQQDINTIALKKRKQ